MGVEYRAGGTGQSGVARAEMLVLMNRQRLALDQAGTDAVGALAGLAPVSPQPQAGALEGRLLGLAGDTVEDDAARVGQQHGVAGRGQLAVQAVHLAAGDLQHLTRAFAALEHARVLQHHRRHALRRVQVMLLQAAQPGAGYRRICRGAGQYRPALCHVQYLLGVATLLSAHCCCSPPRGITPLRASIHQAHGQCNGKVTGESATVPPTGQSVTPPRHAGATLSLRQTAPMPREPRTARLCVVWPGACSG